MVKGAFSVQKQTSRAQIVITRSLQPVTGAPTSTQAPVSSSIPLIIKPFLPIKPPARLVGKRSLNETCSRPLLWTRHVLPSGQSALGTLPCANSVDASEHNIPTLGSGTSEDAHGSIEPSLLTGVVEPSTGWSPWRQLDKATIAFLTAVLSPVIWKTIRNKTLTKPVE